jgi:cytochrome P450/glutathione S-transferase
LAYWYKLTSVRISPYSELARWVLELRGIAYEESCHVPILNVPYTKAAASTVNVPAIRAPDAAFEVHELLTYLEARARTDEKLFSADPSEYKQIDDFVGSILTDLAIAIRLYAYGSMLPNGKVTGALMMTRSPWWERTFVRCCYPMLAKAMRSVLKITPSSMEAARREIVSSFESISQRIQSDSGFLFGDRLTIADLVFAAGTAPITLPPEYGAPFPSFADSPPEMQATVTAVQATRAGQLALRIYRGYRTVLNDTQKTSPSAGERWTDWWSRAYHRAVASPGLLRIVSSVLRLKPVLWTGKLTVISSYEEVVKTLEEDDKFTVAEINAARMDRISGPFILGMDRSTEYDRESAAIRGVIKPTDLDWIRNIVSGTTQSLVKAAQPYGRLDVAGSYARVSAARVVAEYFGVPGPTEHILMQWIRSLFWDVFLNRNDAPLVRRAADRSALELRSYLSNLIEQRASERAVGDDILSRLIRAGTLEHESIRRNMTGILVGAIDTTATAAANAIEVLLSKPDAFAQTRQAALANDSALLRQCTYEALRFHPQTPALLRHSKVDGSTVVALTFSAMFDPRAFPEPGKFVSNRPIDRYLHFGGGMHTCYGAMINGVQLPELIAEIVRLPNVKRATGRYKKVIYEGPFPDRLVVEFGG